MSTENRFNELSEDLQNKIKNYVINFPDDVKSFWRIF
jgi:hypothetical protein